jgi:hypothetical protein
MWTAGVSAITNNGTWPLKMCYFSAWGISIAMRFANMAKLTSPATFGSQISILSTNDIVIYEAMIGSAPCPHSGMRLSATDIGLDEEHAAGVAG